MTRNTLAAMAALAALSLGAARAERPAQKDIAQSASKHTDLVLAETPAFHLYLPAGWKQAWTTLREDGTGQVGYASPGRSSKAYVRIGTLRDEPLKALWLRYVEEFLGKRVGKIHVQHYSERAANETVGMAFGSIYGVSRRKARAHIYKFAVMAVRNVLRARIAYLAIGGTQESWREVARHLPIMLRSLDLR
jgi:hypothetical protein